MYSRGTCKVPDCPYLHDLSTTDIQRLLDWKHEQQQHLIFDSQSNGHSHSTGQSNSRESSANEHDSMEAIVNDAARLPSVGPQRQQLYRRLRKHFKGISDTDLAEQLPKDELGRATSIGSLLHASSSCKACRNLVTLQHCKEGLRCCFCHMPHDSTEMMSSTLVEDVNADARRSGVRPAKSQRDKYKRLVARVEQQIQEDPFGWTPERLATQDLFPGRPELQNKFLMRVTDIVEKARTDNCGKETHPSASSSSAAATSAPRVASSSKSGNLSVRRGRKLISL